MSKYTQFKQLLVEKSSVCLKKLSKTFLAFVHLLTDQDGKS
jgi:hypothetical protein